MGVCERQSFWCGLYHWHLGLHGWATILPGFLHREDLFSRLEWDTHLQGRFWLHHFIDLSSKKTNKKSKKEQKSHRRIRKNESHKMFVLLISPNNLCFAMSLCFQVYVLADVPGAILSFVCLLMMSWVHNSQRALFLMLLTNISGALVADFSMGFKPN